MPLPIANFGFSRDGKDVTFSNLTLNKAPNPIYAWDFGDGQNSTIENPSVTYTADGFYQVTLEVTNDDGNSTIMMQVGVGTSLTMLNVTLLELCTYYLPTTYLSNTSQLVTYIQTWQIYLQPLVENPLVLVENTHNETQWPALVNKLIAMLVARDIIEKEATAFLANVVIQGKEILITDPATGNQRSVKTIETGPVKTEWYQQTSSTDNSEIIKNLSSSFMKALAPGGIVDLLRKSSCNLSKRMMIYLPECGKLNINPTAFVKGNTPLIGSSLNYDWYTPDNWEKYITW